MGIMVKYKVSRKSEQYNQHGQHRRPVTYMPDGIQYTQSQLELRQWNLNVRCVSENESNGKYDICTLFFKFKTFQIFQNDR